MNMAKWVIISCISKKDMDNIELKEKGQSMIDEILCIEN